MSAYDKLINWLDSYREVAFDLLRIYLGVGLFVRGLLFFYDPSAYTGLVPEGAPAMLTSPALLYFVAFVHLVGGAMMAVGYRTRIAALAQLPILLGAVFVAQLQGGLFTTSQSFEFSALVLLLLLLIFAYGSGHWSLDEWQHRESVFRRINARKEHYREIVYAALRLYLGIGLFVRGALFIADSSAFIDLLPPSAGKWLTSVVLIHYVAIAHLAGGVLMAVGLLTRLAALVQIPILLGAVFIVHFQGGLLAPSQSLEFSVLVLFLLVFIFFYGSGVWSADHYIFSREPEKPLQTHSPLADEILHREIPELPEEEEGYAPVLTAERTATKTLTCPLTGTCPVTEAPVPREHQWIRPEARYSGAGWFLFMVDVTPEPKEIVYTCGRCGQVIDHSDDPEDMEQHRYR